MTAHATHQVLNQARPATGWNAFSGDAVLRGIVARGAPWVAEKATALGQQAGDAACCRQDHTDQQERSEAVH